MNDHKCNHPAKTNICQNLTENVQDQQVNNTYEAIIMLPTGAIERISITTTKQTEDNQKLTIKGSIPNIQK